MGSQCRSRSRSNGAGGGRISGSLGKQRDRMELMPCLRHKALNAQMRDKISPGGGAGGGEIDRSRSGSRSRNRCRSRSSTYASRSRSRSRERNGNDDDDDDDDDNTMKTAPPKPRRSRNDLNQQDCGHNDNDKGVINIPIHTPNGLKSALKKPESKGVINVPIHTSGQSRNRSEEHCLPINIPIYKTTTIAPQKERSTIRPWRKSNKEESTWSSYYSNKNHHHHHHHHHRHHHHCHHQEKQQGRINGEDLVEL